MLVVVVMLKLVEGMVVDERKGSRVEIGWSLEELMEGIGGDKEGRRLV